MINFKTRIDQEWNASTEFASFSDQFIVTKAVSGVYELLRRLYWLETEELLT